MIELISGVTYRSGLMNDIEVEDAVSQGSFQSGRRRTTRSVMRIPFTWRLVSTAAGPTMILFVLACQATIDVVQRIGGRSLWQ